MRLLILTNECFSFLGVFIAKESFLCFSIWQLYVRWLKSLQDKNKKSFSIEIVIFNIVQFLKQNENENIHFPISTKQHQLKEPWRLLGKFNPTSYCAFTRFFSRDQRYAPTKIFSTAIINGSKWYECNFFNIVLHSQ